MGIIKRAQNMSINIKLNLILLITFGVIGVMMGTIMGGYLRNTFFLVIQDRLEQEVSLIQTQFTRAEDDLVRDVRSLASALGERDIFTTQSTSQIRAIILSEAATLKLDHIDVVDASGTRTINVSGEAIDYHREIEDELITLSLLGSDVTGILPADVVVGGTQTLSLAAVIPLKNRDGEIIGAVIGGRAVNSDFLTEVNFGREDIHLGIIYEAGLLARDLSDPEAFNYDLSRHQAGIDQAMRGQVWISDQLENDSNGSPDVVGYMPLRLGRGVGAVIAVKAEADRLFTLQTQFHTTVRVLFLMLGACALTVAVWLARRLVSQPITQLKEVAEKFAQGDYTAQAQTRVNDEIGQLAAAFNNLAETVQNRESELREINANLEKRVADRTIELTRANALAMESIRLKSEFMSTMSHELRTPLNAILGFSGIMLQGMGGEIDDDALHMIERIDSNSQRLLKLINDILDLAKIEAGRMEMADAAFSIHHLVSRWQAETGILAQKKGLAFSVNVDADLPSVLYGDAERITQMAVNLLSNAFKFTDRGEVRLNVTQQAETWSIEVSDTGVGIPPHALNYIFDEFRQVDGSSKRVYGGSGLGLAIVRNMCRMMNGTINVTSELGKGSVFTLTLPLRTEPSTELLETA